MSDLMRADSWMHMVLSNNTPLDVCEKRFREFSLEADHFIWNEIKNRIIPEAEKRGDIESILAYKKILATLEKIIEEKCDRQ